MFGHSTSQCLDLASLLHASSPSSDPSLPCPRVGSTSTLKVEVQSAQVEVEEVFDRVSIESLSEIRSKAHSGVSFLIFRD